MIHQQNQATSFTPGIPAITPSKHPSSARIYLVKFIQPKLTQQRIINKVLPSMITTTNKYDLN
jgi:hypothetical protein